TPAFLGTRGIESVILTGWEDVVIRVRHPDCGRAMVQFTHRPQCVIVERNYSLSRFGLTPANCDRATQEIHVIPPECLDLTRPHRGAEGKYHRQSCVLPLPLHLSSLGQAELFIQCHCATNLGVNWQRLDFV